MAKPGINYLADEPPIVAPEEPPGAEKTPDTGIGRKRPGSCNDFQEFQCQSQERGGFHEVTASPGRVAGAFVSTPRGLALAQAVVSHLLVVYVRILMRVC
jgi:hypothetical protein